MYNAPFCTTLRAEAAFEVNRALQVELVRRRAESGHGARLIRIGTAGTGDGVMTTRTVVYMDGVGRTRVESHGHVTLADRSGTTTIRPDGTVTRSEDRGPFGLEAPALLLMPWPIAAVLAIELVEAGRVEGREGWWVEAGLTDSGSSLMSMALEWWGERFRLGIDAATGVVLSVDGFLDDKTVTQVRWPVFEPDTPIDPVLFDTPEPTPIPVSVDERHQRPLLFRAATGFLGFEGGDPPADQNRSRRQIEAAYAQFDRCEPGSMSLDFVVGGDVLGPLLIDAKRRFPGTEVRLAVVEIAFRNPREAAVLYQLELNGGLFGEQRQGAALLVGEQWKVGYATVAHLIGFAGIDCPPPPADSQPA